MIAAVLSATVAIVLTLFSAAWYLSGRVAKVEAAAASAEKAADAVGEMVGRHLSDTLPTQLENAVLKHQAKCPAARRMAG
jgi:microcompartment protein CcmL/EutN